MQFRTAISVDLRVRMRNFTQHSSAEFHRGLWTFCNAGAMSALTPTGDIPCISMSVLCQLADISLAYFLGAPEILTKALVRIENNIFAVLSL
jgi:hypothetical protein